MDTLKKRLRQIENCQKASRILRYALLTEAILLIIFNKIIVILHLLAIALIFAVCLMTVIAKIILDKVNEAQIDVLKNEYDQLKIKNNELWLLFNDNDTVFLNGPHDEKNTTIIAIRKNNTVKKFMMLKEEAEEIFELENF